MRGRLIDLDSCLDLRLCLYRGFVGLFPCCWMIVRREWEWELGLGVEGGMCRLGWRWRWVVWMELFGAL